MGGLLRNQADISAQVPMPTDRVDDASVSNTVAAETLTWLYVTSSAWASATGQAAGTIVVGKLTYSGVLDSLSSAVGNVDNTSFSFAAATRFSTKVSVPEDVLASLIFMSPTNQKARISDYLTTNGQYCIDHRRGLIWGKALDTVADDTVAYKYATPITGGGTGDKVDVIKIGGVTVPVDDGAFTPGTTPVIPVGFFADETATDSVNEGDTGAARMTLDRRQINAGEKLDDSAFGVGTDYVTPIAALADETATDSVDEGDTGSLRMTLDRKLITAGSFKEDTAHTTADYGLGMLSKRTDTAASSADTDGDYATMNTDSLGKLWTRPDGGAASGATDNGNPIKIGGKYNSTPPTLTDGQRGDAQLDASANLKTSMGTKIAGEDGSNDLLATMQKPLASATYAWLSDNSYGTVTAKSVKATPGNVLSLCAFNDNASVRYLQLHNKASIPTGTNVPVYVVPIPPASGGVPGFASINMSDLGSAGYHCNLGFGWAISTTRNTFTDSATASEHTIFGQYV